MQKRRLFLLSKIYGAGITGTSGYIVSCETDVSDGLPCINMIGQISSEVKEAADRSRTAIRNSGVHLSPSKITINLSPAEIKKTGCGYDLPIAIGILCSSGVIDKDSSKELLENSIFVGELSLDGKINRINGILSITIAARNAGYKRIFIPYENANEASVIENIDCYGVKSLSEVIDILNYDLMLPEKSKYNEVDIPSLQEKDFSDVCGQDTVKRASILAVSGRHNILYIGPAGTGKSMIASRLPTILPRMTRDEQLEISKVYSINGLLPDELPLLTSRPFRAPHHTISSQALCGGGTVPRPGEISLASGGVLFLDELAEFKSGTLDGLRQPLEDKKVVISRVYGSVEYPADFVLVAATNPCKCGYYPDRNRCNCSESMVRNYLGRISKPILDRIDICVEMPNPAYRDLKEKSSGMKSSQIREEVERVREIQINRFKGSGLHFNSEMSPNMIKEYCVLSKEDDEFLKSVYIKKGMSARGLNKILKVARTIADYEGHEEILRTNLCEAINYRTLEEKYRTGGSNYDDKFKIRKV